MALAKDLSQLGVKPPDKEALPGDSEARYAFQEAFKRDAEEGPLAMAIEGTRFRHSWAGGCTRAIAYHMNGTEASNPPDDLAQLTFSLGTHVHDLWQAGFLATHGDDAEIEVIVKIEEIDSSGHTDARLKSAKRSYEVKSINGFGFKNATGIMGQAEGPRKSAVLQGALNAYAADDEELVIVYIALESSSPSVAKKNGLSHLGRMSATWTYPREEFAPVALREIKRIKRIEEYVDAGEPVPRVPLEIPAGARVTDPVTGAWQKLEDGAIMDAGTIWNCSYCNFLDKCSSDLKEGY